MNRRRLLGAMSTAAAGSLAGCSTVMTTTDGRPTATLNAEVLSESGWTQVDTATLDETVTVEQFGQSLDIDVNGTTTIYEEKNIRTRVKEETLGNLDTTFRTFFTTKFELDPNFADLPAGVGKGMLLDQLEPRVQDQFEGQLSGFGLEDITISEEDSITIDTGEEARLYKYDATYAYESLSMPLQSDTNLTLPAGEITFEALLALWVHDGQVLVAGGGQPSENLHEETDVDVTDAISAEVTVDLHLTAEEHSSELRDLITAVE